ncbi:MAG: DUF481 domain-containing protein [Acidobacteriaceae bacterium]
MALFLGGSVMALAQAKPDVLVFTNGDHLTGELISATADKMTFKSAMAGEITVDRSTVKDLKTEKPFAVVKDQKLVKSGTVEFADKQIIVSDTSGTANIAVDPSVVVVEQGEYQKEVTANPGFLHGWTGTTSAGLSFVRATQDQTSFNAAVVLVRVVPSVTWLDPKNRTLVNFNAAYGKTSQPGIPDVKTDIYHGDIERDKYFSKRMFGFGLADFDHNFGQGLRFQQGYGVGVGYTVFNRPNATLDLKADLRYTHQSFYISSNDQNLIGSQISETYLRKLPHSIMFTEMVSATPSYNVPSAYQVNAVANLALPLYKKFDLTFGFIDSYLNNPSPGSKKNSSQFITGLQYVFP